MIQDETDIAEAFEAGADAAIDGLLEQIMKNEDPEHAKGMLRFLARRYPEGSRHALSALTYYRGMRVSLRGAGPRRQRIRQYGWYCELFELEIRATRRQKTDVWAISEDWSGFGAHVLSEVKLWNSGVLLLLAGWLEYMHAGAALDLCDSAAYSLFRSAYNPSAAAL